MRSLQRPDSFGWLERDPAELILVGRGFGQLALGQTAEKADALASPRQAEAQGLKFSIETDLHHRHHRGGGGRWRHGSHGLGHSGLGGLNLSGLGGFETFLRDDDEDA